MMLEDTISGLRQVNVNAFYDDILRKDVNTLVFYEHHHDEEEALPNRIILVRKAVEAAKKQGRKTSLLIENLDYKITEEARKSPEKQKEILYEASREEYNGIEFVWPVVEMALNQGDVFGLSLPRQPELDVAKDNHTNKLLNEIPSSNLKIILFGYCHFPFMECKTSHDVEVIQTPRLVRKLGEKYDRKSIDLTQHPLSFTPRGIFKLENNLYQLNLPLFQK